MMKKKATIVLTIIAALFLIYFVGTGFLKAASACILDYSISEDGRNITIHVGVPASMGYIRKAAVHQQSGGKLYIDCYSAFGGLNGSIGAKSSFTLPLEEDTAVIALYQGADCYREVLRRDTDGVWQRVK